MKRKLVTIRKIARIEPIEGADRIEKCYLDGWIVISQKGAHKAGEDVLFVEIDSFLPIKPEFEFLRKSCYKTMGDLTGFRLKTIRLRGVISQGLILPLDTLHKDIKREKDKDYADILGIIKFVAPIPAQLAGDVVGMFPGFLCPRTDQQRIQNLPEYFEEHSEIEFEVSEKLDGASTSYMWDGENFRVCSRNLELKEGENTLWNLAREYKLPSKLREFTPHAIQGEVIGEGIQKNPYKLRGQDFYVFDIYNIDERRYLTSKERVGFCEELGLKHVPIVGETKLKDYTMEKMIKGSEGKSILNPLQEREGLVFKSLKLIDNQTISFKIINNKCL